MKISQVANKTGLSIGAIRHYINLNIIMPSKKNTKFFFDKKEITQLLFIKQLKDMGLTIRDIEKIISLKSISNWVEPDDLNDYKNLLLEHKSSLDNEVRHLMHQLTATNKELESIDHINQTQTLSESGLPLNALSILQCPTCQVALNISNTKMNYNYIFDGQLTCSSCNYRIDIINGILVTPSPNPSKHDHPDLSRSVYKDNPKEIVNHIQKTSEWMNNYLPSSDKKTIFMETHLNSFFYLYKNLSTLNRDNIYILVDKFPEILRMYKRNIDYLELDLNIIYICNNTLKLPIQKNIVDIFIDYGSSNEHELFNKTSLIQHIDQYMTTDSSILSTYFSFDTVNKTRSKINEMYPMSHLDNFNMSRYTNIFNTHAFFIQNSSRICKTKFSGNGISFIFHHNGDTLYMDSMIFKKTPPKV